MGIEEIVHEFMRRDGGFPRTALESAVRRREEITPVLLQILEDTANRAGEIAAQHDYMAHFYAMYLLAEFREVRAYPSIVRIARLQADLLDSLLNFFMTDGLDRVLASVCGGEQEGIKSIVESPEANEWARGAALSSIVTLTLAGQLSREETIDYLSQLFHGKVKREASQVWNSLITCCCDLGAGELMDEIKQAYAEGLVDPAYTSLKDVESDMSLTRISPPSARLIEDAIGEIENWCRILEKEVPRLETRQDGAYQTGPDKARAAAGKN